MRVALDSNVLVYAFIRNDEKKHLLAADLMIRASLTDVILPAQVLGEFMAVIRRKFGHFADEAAEQIALWAATFTIVDTTETEVIEGARFALHHQLQVWDAIIWRAAASAGASYLLSEDMHDGLTLDGLTVINPFKPANAALIGTLLAPMEGIERPLIDSRETP